MDYSTKTNQMANKQDIDFSYSTIDKIHRLALGETADLSGARFLGDFSMSVEEGQLAKHRFMAEQLHIREGSKVLDMGCGWGPFLNYLQKIGAEGTGLTLSEGQYRACKEKGFDVHVKDVRTVTPEDFGTFDAVVSVGAFEHFCSLEEYKAGKQEIIYKNFFETVHRLLPEKGRFYLQTMVSTDKMPAPDTWDIRADKNSISYICALTEKFFPGSWLPYGSEMILKNAEPYFNLVYISSGRADYIETILKWRKMFRRFHLKKYALYLEFILQNLFSNKFRHLIDVFRINPIRVCFERDVMEHYRMVLEKK
jgi:cyclopropane-fatty-acyl-phospholipid synthase